MFRFSRTRRTDLVFKSDRVKEFRPYDGKNVPGWHMWMICVMRYLPMIFVGNACNVCFSICWWISNHGLCFVYTFEHLFGLRCCQNCPECNVGQNPCQYLFGSSATAEGCIVGRSDAVDTSIEAHTSTGNLHAHSPLFVQCLHQHTSLHELIKLLRKDFQRVVRYYFDFKAHVCRRVYHTDERELAWQLEQHETAWPEYKEVTCLATVPE